MAKVLGRNRHQKAAHRVGEQRVGREQLEELLELSRSHDADERLEAASLMCPCHVRRRVDDVWAALYRLMEDPDVRVRRAAWHTLEDGGHPDDPALDPILDRVLATETDSQVRRFAEHVAGPRRQREREALKLQSRNLAHPAPKQRGRCDFCGAANVPVEWDPQTIIPSGNSSRVALICDRCADS
jgi:hypothetical protein